MKTTAKALAAALALSFLFAVGYIGWLAYRMTPELAEHEWAQLSAGDTWTGSASQWAGALVFFLVDSHRGGTRLDKAFVHGGGLPMDQGVANALRKAPQDGLFFIASSECDEQGGADNIVIALEASPEADLKSLKDELFYNSLAGESQADKLHWWYFSAGGNTLLRTLAPLLPNITSYAAASDRSRELAQAFPTLAVECVKATSGPALAAVLRLFGALPLVAAFQHPESAPATFELRGSALPPGKLTVTSPEFGPSSLSIRIEVPAGEGFAAFKRLEHLLPPGLSPKGSGAFSMGRRTGGHRGFRIKDGRVELMYVSEPHNEEVAFTIVLNDRKAVASLTSD